VLIPTQGNLHVNPGGTHAVYNTNPPTSGPHFPIVPQRGVYTTPFVTEYLPHFLEHGGVEVQYNKDAPPPVIKALTDIVRKELDHDIGQVLLAPRPDMPCEVTITSWQRVEAFGTADCQPGSLGHTFDAQSAADASQLATFIERNMCFYDPENICGHGLHGELVFATPAPGEPTVTATLPAR
jgi:hypothetical protein